MFYRCSGQAGRLGFVGIGPCLDMLIGRVAPEFPLGGHWAGEGLVWSCPLKNRCGLCVKRKSARGL